MKRDFGGDWRSPMTQNGQKQSMLLGTVPSPVLLDYHTHTQIHNTNKSPFPKQTHFKLGGAPLESYHFVVNIL